MRSKILSLFGMSVLALLLCLTLVSAAITFTNIPTLKQDGTTPLTFNMSSDENDGTINLAIETITEDGKSITFTSTSVTLDNETKEVTISYTIPTDFDFKLEKTYSTTLTASGANVSADANQTISFEKTTEFCEYSNPGKLDVKIKDFTNKGIGKDDEWYPFDVIEVEVEVENKGNQDIDDITLEWGVYDSDGEWIIEPVDEDDFNLDEDEEEKITFEIDLDDDLDVDLDELNDGSYTLYVRATGEREDSEDYTCESDSEKIDVVIENDYVILTELEVVGTPFCGSTIQVKAKVVNIGEDDQDDVYVEIYNSDLGIDEEAIIGDINAFDDKTLSFEFTIPTDLDEKIYLLHLDVYDEDDDIYENSNDDKSKHTLSIDVSGNCVRVADAVVYASLESGGKAGQEMQIRASVTNTGSETKTFTIDAADYSSWAELVSIEPSSLTLDADEEKDVIITLNVDNDAPEESTFSIVLEDEDGETVTQPVLTTIEKGFSLKGIFGDKGYIWGIAILNVILIIIIILVAIKVSRR